MPRRVASATGRKVRPAPKGHKLAEEFPPGMVLRDLCKKDWLLGSVLGQGGFGLIYLASDNASRSVDPKTANYVIKIEPKGNGPLFCEIHFYQRVAKPSSIDAFVNKHRLRYLGIPPYTGTGLVTYKSQEYRFLVMPRCGKDLQKLLQECRGKFEPHTTFAVGLRMVDALQFLHENEYVHADIKAANILLGFSRGSEVKNEVYLVDYGLAYRYTVGSEHKDYKEDPKKAHNGTITFTSRDAHRGLAPSRRGDLEILGYCMLQWVCGKLPWENNLTNPTYVAECKEGFMKNVQAQVTACIPGNTHVSGCISSYFESVNRLAYNSEPNYNQIRGILRNGLAGSGQKDEWRIEFTSQTKGVKRTSMGPETSDMSPSKRTPPSPRKPAKVKHASPRAVASPAATKLPSPLGIKTSPLTKKRKPTASSKTVSSAAAGRHKVSPSSSKTRSGQPSLPNGNKAFNSGRPRYFPMPAPTPATPQATKVPTKRRVQRRVTTARTDMSVQTTPGLFKNI